MSDYDIRPGGSLKLKGVIEGGVKKYAFFSQNLQCDCLIKVQLFRKKKSEKSKSKIEKLREKERISESLLQHDQSQDVSTSAGGSGRNSPSVGGSKGSKTEAERRFEEIQKRRVSVLIS